MGDNTHECNGCGLELKWTGSLENIRPEDLACPNADVGCEGIMKPIDFSKSDGRLFDKAWDISKNTCRRCSNPRMSNSSYCSNRCKQSDQKDFALSGGMVGHME